VCPGRDVTRTGLVDLAALRGMDHREVGRRVDGKSVEDGPECPLQPVEAGAPRRPCRRSPMMAGRGDQTSRARRPARRARTVASSRGGFRNGWPAGGVSVLYPHRWSPLRRSRFVRARPRSVATVTSSASRYCSTLAHNAKETNHGPPRPVPAPSWRVVRCGRRYPASLSSSIVRATRACDNSVGSGNDADTFPMFASGIRSSGGAGA
jgi:hypothetical protein